MKYIFLMTMFFSLSSLKQDAQLNGAYKVVFENYFENDAMLLFTEIILNGDHSVSYLLKVKLTTIKTPFIWKVIQIQFMESVLKTLKMTQSISMYTTEMEKEIG